VVTTKSGKSNIEYARQSLFAKGKVLKRTRRIEFIRYTRRVTTRDKDEAPYVAESAVADSLVEVLGSEEFGPESGARVDTAPAPTFLRRLLRLPAIPEHSQSEEQNIKKENEP
jgi:hypothetical protein